MLKQSTKSEIVKCGHVWTTDVITDAYYLSRHRHRKCTHITGFKITTYGGLIKKKF